MTGSVGSNNADSGRGNGTFSPQVRHCVDDLTVVTLVFRLIGQH